MLDKAIIKEISNIVGKENVVDVDFEEVKDDKSGQDRAP